MIAGPTETGAWEHQLKAICQLVSEIEQRAQRLVEEALGIQAVERNARRILASTRILKLNFCDPSDLS